MDKLQKARGPTTIWTANLESPILLAIQQGAWLILIQNCSSSLFNIFYSAVAASNLPTPMPMPEADVYTLGNAYENCGKRILIRLDRNRSTLVEL